MSHSQKQISDMTRSGLNLIKQAISIYDKNLELVIANRRFGEMFELPERLTAVGATFFETVKFLAERGDYGPIDDVDAFMQERVDQARAFSPHYFERDRDNGTRISVEGSPLRQGGWVTVYTDITETRNQEEMLRGRSDDLTEKLVQQTHELTQANRALTATVTALEEAKNQLTESEARTQMTAEMTPAHIARVDMAGIYTYSNKKLSSIVPGRPQDIEGLTLSEALGPEVHAHVYPRFLRALEGEASVFEFHLNYINRNIRVAFTPDQASDGSIQGAYLLSMDITAETQARQALAHSRRRELAAQLTSGMAHDFANLLTIILGQINKLETMPDLSQDAALTVQTTKAAALRGGGLLEGLTNLTAQRDLRVGAIDISKFIATFEPLARAALPNGVKLILQNDLGAQPVLLDQGFLQDALLNLTLNAQEAMKGVGCVTIAFRRNQDWLEITVLDTGPGFSEAVLQNAFAPFFTTKQNAAGHGLGLSNVFDFAKLSGGRASMNNPPEGGAELTISIPYQEPQVLEPGLILLVEDTDSIRETIRGHLRNIGHTVVEATNAEDALELIKIDGLDHVVTDLMLGGEMTGLDFANHMNALRPDVPILIVTGLPTSDPIHQAAAKAFPLLGKPFSQDQLLYAMQGAKT